MLEQCEPCKKPFMAYLQLPHCLGQQKKKQCWMAKFTGKLYLADVRNHVFMHGSAAYSATSPTPLLVASTRLCCWGGLFPKIPHFSAPMWWVAIWRNNGLHAKFASRCRLSCVLQLCSQTLPPILSRPTCVRKTQGNEWQLNGQLDLHKASRVPGFIMILPERFLPSRSQSDSMCSLQSSNVTWSVRQSRWYITKPTRGGWSCSEKRSAQYDIQRQA